MWTKTAVLCVLFTFLVAITTGEPSNYRTYRIVSGSSSPYYDYYGGSYAEPSYRYNSGSIYNDKVYITDRYGNTVSQSSSDYYNRIHSSARITDQYCTGCYYRSAVEVTTCTASTCGQNAQCSTIGGRPVCSCFRGYSGDPLSLCTRAECLSDGECRGHLTCKNGKCIDPCAGVCGINSDCQTRNHIPVCSCPPGYTGNPFSSCRRFDPSELCHPSPCGANTNCEVINNVPTCKCKPGFLGSPLAGCRHECESDSECSPGQGCIDFRCQNPCTSQCGENADCQVRNHAAVCSCPKNYFGNPLLSCKPECYGDVDCPPGRPACFYGICKSPCEGVCGVGANCELRGLTPVCSCPKDMTGDPFVRCRPFEARDLCEPNPCGANAYCEPGFETRNPSKERPVCFCNTGYIGNPVVGCQRGECISDAECPNNKACIDYSCQNPCVGRCGLNAECNTRNHIAVCTCPRSYQGDAIYQCNLNPSTSAARYLRYKRTSEQSGSSNSTITAETSKTTTQ